MTAVAEAPARLEIMEPVTSDLVYREVIARSQDLNPLLGQTQEQQRFYGEMGVQRTGLTTFSGDNTLYKLELDQESGAFKSRGAAYGVAKAAERDPEVSTVNTASAGNHGNGVAIAASRLGLSAVVECAETVSIVKADKLAGNGATVHATHPNLETGMSAARQTADEDNRVAFIHPFDDLDVIAGQATMGYELIADLLDRQDAGNVDLLHDPVTVYVPIGGGGLITGVACAFRWAKESGLLGEQVRVVGVQMEGCDAMNRAVDAYRLGQDVDKLFAEGEFNPMADGTAVTEVGKYTLPVVANERLVADVVTVTEAQLFGGMKKLAAHNNGRRVEPAGALATAGVQAHGRPGELNISLVTGGNVSAETYEYFRRAETRARDAELQAYRQGLMFERKPHWLFDTEEGLAYMELPEQVIATSGLRVASGHNFR
jgi:threonine dehydratase